MEEKEVVVKMNSGVADTVSFILEPSQRWVHSEYPFCDRRKMGKARSGSVSTPGEHRRGTIPIQTARCDGRCPEQKQSGDGKRSSGYLLNWGLSSVHEKQRNLHIKVSLWHVG